MFDETLEELNIQNPSRLSWPGLVNPQSLSPRALHSTPIGSGRTLPGTTLFNDSLSIIFDEENEENRSNQRIRTESNISGQAGLIPDRQSSNPLLANTLLRRSTASNFSHSTSRSHESTSSKFYQDKLIHGVLDLGLSHQDVLNYSSEAERTNRTYSLKRYIPLAADERFCYKKNPDFEIDPKAIVWNKRTNRVTLPCEEGLVLWHPIMNHMSILPMELKGIRTMAWNVEQSILAVADNEGKLVFWNSETDKKTKTELQFNDKVHIIELMAWSSYCLALDQLEILFIITRDGTFAEVRVDLPTTGLKRISKTKMANPTAMVVSSDGSRVACSTSGGDVSILKVKSFENLTTNEFQLIGNYGEVISWCPWQPKVLAVGSSVGKTLTILSLGGSVPDQTFSLELSATTCRIAARIQSTTSCLDSITSLAWSGDFKEILSGHGAPHPSVVCWKFPDMTKVFMIDFSSPVLFIDVQLNLESCLVALTASSQLTVWRCFDIEMPLGRVPNPVDERRRRKRGRRSKNLSDISFGCLEGLIR